MAFPIIRVTKLDAARRQTDTAIELWFHDADPVSIQTLLYAAHEIIHGLFKKQGLSALFFDTELMKNNPEMRRTAKDWPNFFKHGRAYELDRVLDFNTEANLILFSANLAGLREMKIEYNDIEFTFSYYLLLHHPDYFTLSPESAGKEDTPFNKRLRGYAKQEFLEEFLGFLALHPEWKMGGK